MKRALYRLIPENVLKFIKSLISKKELSEKEWREKGCPSPPPHVVKQLVIEEYQKKYGISVLVETGTYRGDMIEAQKKRFKKIISVELGIDFFEKAKDRFKNDGHVVLRNGNSGVIMPQILDELNEPAIFWLDGHYMPGITEKANKECPVYEELEAILSQKNVNHVLLIDDARLFTGKYDYPTISELVKFVGERNNKYNIEVKYDIIRMTRND
jgi:hypothetical protein